MVMNMIMVGHILTMYSATGHEVPFFEIPASREPFDLIKLYAYHSNACTLIYLGMCTNPGWNLYI